MGGVRVSIMHMSDDYWYIEDVIEKLVKNINVNDGWIVVGWYKRGVINDRNVIECLSNKNMNNNTSNVNTEVSTSEFSYHIVHMIPINLNMVQNGTPINQ